MLAQNFKSAADLRLNDKQRDALIKTLALLDSGQLQYINIEEHEYDVRSVMEKKFTGNFNMSEWTFASKQCGTVACIGGTACLIAHDLGLFPNPDYSNKLKNEELHDLFYPPLDGSWNDITPEQAATALRSYLTTGNAQWKAAVQS